jgi:serine protease Do
MPQNAIHNRWRAMSLVLAVGIGAWATCTSAVQGSALRRTPEVIAIEQARPSVVNIHGRKTIATEPNSTATDGIQQVNGMGTGIVIDERGYIVTNYHVVEGVGRIQVTTSTGLTVIAQLVSHDAKTDLAIIKIDVDELLPVIRLGTSHDLLTGEPVIAIGNAYGYTHTVTRGIISALHRPIEVSEHQSYRDLIQTDASINPGNSGGPLLNIDGEMIGINVAVRMGAQGIGFALPVDEAMDVVARLIGTEVDRKVEHGITGKTMVDERGSRYVITAASQDSPAFTSGVRPGDMVLTLDKQRIARELDYQRVLLSHSPGDEVLMTVMRNGAETSLSLVLGEPANQELSVAERAWQVLGLRLTPSPTQAVRQRSSRYRGGMRVTAVRPGSPAGREGIRDGDILVGLHKWETISLENIAYILDSDEFTDAQPAKFYILRGNDTLFGQIRISQVDETRLQ